MTGIRNLAIGAIRLIERTDLTEAQVTLPPWLGGGDLAQFPELHATRIGTTDQTRPTRR